MVDQAAGPGSQFPDATAAARSQNALAAINGGFFTPEGKPLGLVVSRGRAIGYWNTASSLGSGVWHESTTGHTAIHRRQKLGKSATLASHEALQAGPVLIENSKAISGLSDRKSAARTLLLWDGNTRWWMGRSSSCTLAALASTLSRQSPAGWPVQTALNLDGGRSSELWISSRVPGGPISTRPLWNRPVRNFLVLKPR